MIDESWSGFFTAAAGASAALAGLIIVAMSVSVDLMISIKGMTSRAASAIAVLVAATVISLAALIPHQPSLAFGVETLVAGGAALGFAIDSMAKVIRARQGETGWQIATKTTFGLAPGLLFVAGAVAQFAAGQGLTLVAGGIIAAIVVSAVNAWVVLVEIKR